MFLITKRTSISVLAWFTAMFMFLPVNNAQALSTGNIQSAPGELRQFIEIILPVHPRYVAAKAELGAARALYDAADNAIYNPELELDAEKTDIQTATIGLSQTLDWGDQRGAKTQITKYRLDAAEAKLQRERQQLIQDLLISLNYYQNKTRLAELSIRRLKIMKDFYDVAQKRYAAGDLSQVELDLAQLAYSESIFKNAQILSDQVRAEQDFYALYSLGSGASSSSLPDLSFDFKNIKIPTGLDAFLLTLPQMRMLRANVDASKYVIDLRQGESIPDPTIALRGGKEDEETLAGLTLTIPLNFRNPYRAEIEAARKEYLQAEQLAQQAYRNIRRDIKSLTRHYQLTFSAWRQWQTSGKVSVERQLRFLKRLWQAGDLSTTDYLVQIKQNLDTQSAGIELDSTLWVSWLTWLEATAQIETWLQLKDTRTQ
ncbi:MAG: TolC family protein [Acidiferrobacterales bacterium]